MVWGEDNQMNNAATNNNILVNVISDAYFSDDFMRLYREDQDFHRYVGNTIEEHERLQRRRRELVNSGVSLRALGRHAMHQGYDEGVNAEDLLAVASGDWFEDFEETNMGRSYEINPEKIYDRYIREQQQQRRRLMQQQLERERREAQTRAFRDLIYNPFN